MKGKALVAALLPTILLAALHVDYWRNRCDPQWSPARVPGFGAWLISLPWQEDAGNALWRRFSADDFEDYPLFLFQVQEAPTPPARWRDYKSVQWSEIAIIPPLELAVVTPRKGDLRKPSVQRQEIAKFLAANPSATLLAAEERPFPRFLLVQFGGGFEGLYHQYMIHEGTDAIYSWKMTQPTLDIGELDENHLPPAKVISVPKGTVQRLLAKAETAQLANSQRLCLDCNILDGGVSSYTYSDGNRVGRLLLHNYRVPPLEVRELGLEIERYVGSEKRHFVRELDAKLGIRGGSTGPNDRAELLARSCADPAPRDRHPTERGQR